MKKNRSTLFQNALSLVLAMLILLSGCLGIRAQAAKNKPKLQLPDHIFGETWFVEYDKELNTSIAVYDPASEETIETYVNDLAKELKLNVETEQDEDDKIYTLYKRSDVYLMVFKDLETGMVYMVFFHDNLDLISSEESEVPDEKNMPISGKERRANSLSFLSNK